MQRLAILGSTGSIGVSTLDVVRQRTEFSVFSLAAGSNASLLAEQIEEFCPAYVSIESETGRQALLACLEARGVPKNDFPIIETGAPSRLTAATAAEADCLVSAIVGVAGLEATYEAAKLGKRIGLANKEALVASGSLLMRAAADARAEIIPIDSEHNGAHQCLRGGRRDEVLRLILTASGGPFRRTPMEKLRRVTPDEALAHPTWKMGRRITIDSATMMNKGFEMIEACHLFGLPPKQVDVVIHPQSKVHAMIEFRDGSLLAQISATDMRMPIQYALTYPDRLDAPVPRLDWTVPSLWEFEPPDRRKFPLLRIAYEAFDAGGTSTCILNAADEIAVEAFLEKRIAFPEIAEVIQETLDRAPSIQPSSIGEVLEADRIARLIAGSLVAERTATHAAT